MTRRFIRRDLGERPGFVRLERAKRSDARQNEARAPARRNECVGERRGGALSRHVDRRIGQRQRAPGGGKALDQHAVEEGAAQRRQEGRARRNCEDARGANRHALLSRRAGAKTRFGAVSELDNPIRKTGGNLLRPTRDEVVAQEHSPDGSKHWRARTFAGASAPPPLWRLVAEETGGGSRRAFRFSYMRQLFDTGAAPTLSRPYRWGGDANRRCRSDRWRDRL